MRHRWLLTAFILTVFIAFIITGCGSFIKRASAEKRSVNKDMEDNKYAGTKQTFGSEQTFEVETNRTIDTEKADAKAVAQNDESCKSDSRSFYMAFTPFTYAFTLEAKQWTYSMITRNADAILYHLDQGVPWQEVYSKTPYPGKVENEITDKIRNKPIDNKLILMASPLNGDRTDLAGYWNTESHEPRPAIFKEKTFNDKIIIDTYIEYCRQIIDRFQPTYFIYAVEVNVLRKQSPDKWQAFTELCAQTYTALKKEYPDLPISVSIQLDEFHNDVDDQTENLLKIMKYTDYIAISSYPYAFSGHPNPGTLPSDYFSIIRNIAPEKPFAVAETGFTAEDVSITGLSVKGNEDFQNQYMQLLMKNAQEQQAEFICWYIPRDYDELWEQLLEIGTTEWFVLWKDNGVISGDGSVRKSFETWRSWYEKPRKN